MVGHNSFRVSLHNIYWLLSVGQEDSPEGGESYRLRGKKKYLEGNIPSSEPELETSDSQVKTD